MQRHAVEPHAHHAAGKRRRHEVPLAVQRPGWIHRSVALHIRHTLKAKGEDLSPFLKGEEDASFTGFQTEDLVVDVKSGRFDPCGDEQRIELLRKGVGRHLRPPVLRVELPARGRRQTPQSPLRRRTGRACGHEEKQQERRFHADSIPNLRARIDNPCAFSYIGRVFWSGTDAFSIPIGRKLRKKREDGSCACGGRHGKDND